MWVVQYTNTNLNGMIFVESGKMMVRVYQNDYDLVDETILKLGDFMRVKWCVSSIYRTRRWCGV